MSNISALLREAAREVSNEEKEDAEEMFQIAAIEIENENMKTEDPESPPKAYKKYSNYDVKEDVNELLNQMSLKPKYGGDTMDDVAVLLAMEKPIERSISPEPSPRYAPRRERAESPPTVASPPRRRQPRLSTRSLASGPSYRSLDASEMSRVSLLLRESDDKPWGEDIKTAFASSQQEILFRSMKVVRPQSAQTKQRLAREASLRNQKFRTSDLSIHAPRPGQNDALKKKKEHEYMRQSADRLCVASQHHPSRADLKVDPTLAYSTYDDAKECTFKPKINGKTTKKKENKDNDDGRVEDTKYSFINRQEAEERNRRDQLDFKMGQANYDALVDKKACPQCGNKQSYDEFKEKRKMCGNCRVEYVPAVSWSKVGKRFFRTNLEYSQKIAEKKQQMRQALENEFKCVHRTELDPTTGKTITYKDYAKQALTPEEEAAFFDRLDEMMARREASVKALDEKLAQEKYPFKPTITSKLRKKGNQSDESSSEEEDDEDGTGAVQAFLRRYREDLEERRGKYPGKYIRSKHQDEEELEPFRISKSITRVPLEHL